MIQFTCHCGHSFALDDAEASGLVQCPDCKRLCDVPAHQDLAHLEADGTIALKPLEVTEEPDRLAVLSQIYSKTRQDEAGNDIDFRPTAEDLADRGVPADHGPEKIPRPRYDPETGQLIRPIDVVPAPPRAAIPVAAPVLGYVRNGAELPGRWHGALGILLMPVNLVTIAFVMIAMIVANICIISACSNYRFGLVLAAAIELLILGHYGTVIEEVGIDGREELPRFLRNVEFHGDIWAPMVNTLGSLLLCYALAIVLLAWLQFSAVGWIAGGVLAVAGTWFFPAVLLTLCSSDSSHNLRPDRVIGVIRASGMGYFAPMIVWTITAGLFAGNSLLYIWLIMHPDMAMGTWLPIVGGLLVWRLATVPMMHLFGIQLGLLYRRDYDQFPWIHQRHQRVAA